MIRPLLALAATLVLPALVSGQATRVWPSVYQTQAGEGAMSAPFTLNPGQIRNDARSITTIDAQSLPFGPGSVINELAFRRDTLDAQTYGAVTGYCEVYIGVVENGMLPTGNARWLMRDAKKVFAGNLSIPAASRPSSGTAPFSLVIPFQSTWTYPGGDLGFEVSWVDSAGNKWRRDAVEIEDRVDGTFSNVGGHGMFGTHDYAPMQWIDPGEAVPGGQLTFHLEGAPPERPFGSAVHYLGQLRSQPIQLQQHPYVGGEFWIEPFLSRLLLTSDHASEYARATVSWNLNNDPALSGIVFASQWLVLDAHQNVRIPVLPSDAMTVEVGSASTTDHIAYGRSLWAYGKGSNRNQALQRGPRNYVPVTRFGGTFQ
ncbi:MAG: hypothetical protein KDB80_06940 [Planctomycetes bacterium]|nr:hypothetical protein [Planctomycetota bacterium]